MSTPNDSALTDASSTPDSRVGSSDSSAGMSLGETAARASQEWSPFTQNHDPSYWRALRGAYAEGFMRGFNSCADSDAKTRAALEEIIRWHVAYCAAPPQGSERARCESYLYAAVREAERLLALPNIRNEPRHE